MGAFQREVSSTRNLPGLVFSVGPEENSEISELEVDLIDR